MILFIIMNKKYWTIVELKNINSFENRESFLNKFEKDDHTKTLVIIWKKFYYKINSQMSKRKNKVE